MFDQFEQCQIVSEHLNSGREREARDALIQLLDSLEAEGAAYTPLVNHLIREAGLYPYLEPEHASWSDRFAYESFKADVGGEIPLPLHREQSLLLAKLLAGTDLAVSAPTSFGKSFVIDAFISIHRPANVVIIVPTIALTDETRRRLQKKFSSDYKIITTSDVTLGPRNIFVFPQERAIGYFSILVDVDILIVDEFYKASEKFDKERAPSLLRTILKLSAVAKQRYFLAPNISALNESPFTKGMEFLELDFNTVFLKKHELYERVGKDEKKKSEALKAILKKVKGKSLIYAGTYASVDNVGTLLADHLPIKQSKLLNGFANWLSTNYTSTWNLISLVRRGTGIHTGQLHRSLSQIQVRLFEEEEDGLENLISTSSIVEGVNTSARNVIVWRCKNGRLNLNDFMYRNIVGRGGRMFKHFVGDIYVLEPPPNPAQTELELVFPDSLLADVDENTYRAALKPEQIAKIAAYKDEMRNLIGREAFDTAMAEGRFQTTDSDLLRTIAISMKSSPRDWNGLGYLNSPNPADWERLLYKVINLVPGGWETQYAKYVAFVQILSNNWQHSIPVLLEQLESVDLGVNDFFKLERNVSFKLSALIADVNAMHRIMFTNSTDVSPFAAKLSNAFLPRCVYELEEYGLPRMLAKKVHHAGLLDLEDPGLDLHSALARLRELGPDRLVKTIQHVQEFDRYILTYFFEGIS